MIRRTAARIFLIAELTPGAMLILFGLTVAVGGSTGVLWH